MAFELSRRAELLAAQIGIQTNIILEIDDLNFVFGLVPVEKNIEYGDAGLEYGDAGVVYGGKIEHPNSEDVISLQGTTRTIRQQIEPEREGAQSTQKVNIQLIDKNGRFTKAFQPGNLVEDVLSKRCNVYLGIVGGSHPQDSIRILRGIVADLDFGAGFVRLSINHPEELKRIDLFQKFISNLSGAIGAGDTTIAMDSTTGLFEPADVLRTFVRIDDEVIEFTGISGSSITGATRGALGTTAATHDDNAEVSSFYQLEDDPLDLAQKIMLSGGDLNFSTGNSVTRFVQVDAVTTLTNGLLLPENKIADKLGLTIGDLITVSGATNAANNFTDRTISSIVEIDSGDVIVVDGAALATEIDSSAVASFKSRYNVLPDGCQMDPTLVDVGQFDFFKTLLSIGFPTLKIFLKDTIEAKELINKELLFVNNFYPIPRKGRNSINFTLPPLAAADSPVLDDTTVISPQNLVIKRSINKNFFNSVVYKFEEDVLEDEFLAGQITLSAKSTNRIKVPNRVLTIESKGLRDDTTTRNFITRQTRRWLDRFQFGSEHIKVQPNWKTGFAAEAGDIVLFGENLKVSDFKTGDRQFATRLMEITNKSFDIRGNVTFELTDTAFSTDGRFGVIGPASKIASGATTTTLPLKVSFSTPSGGLEQNKWQDYVGEEVLVHNNDFTFSETVTFTGFSQTQPNVMQLNPALSSPPAEDYVVEMPTYGVSGNTIERRLWKNVHVFFTPQVAVVSGASDTVFDVAAGDIGKFFVGSLVRVHSADYASDSSPTVDLDDAEVIDITSTTITVDRSLGFTPSSSDFVDLIGFADEGLPYRFF